MHMLRLFSNFVRQVMLALVLLLAGCCKEQPVAAAKHEPPWWETNKDSQIMRRRAEEGAALLKQADAVLEVSGTVHFLSPKLTNDLTTLANYETALVSVGRRHSAVIVFPAFNYTAATNQAAQAVAILKQCGFQTVRLAVSGWGMTFPSRGQNSLLIMITGALIVRSPDQNFDREGRGAFSTIALKIGKTFYRGIDRMAWFDLDED
jgi:hypothetical protein